MNTEFLQSAEWLRLQQATGKVVLPLETEGFLANGIVHELPVVGKYLYIPRGPQQANFQLPTRLPDGQVSNFQKNIQSLVEGAKEKKMKWVRIEPETEEVVEEIKELVPFKVVRAPHDMQPREIFKIDITKTEEELLAQMKSKTRYNIRLAEKRGVQVFETREEKYITAFLDLITATSGRKGITSHPRSYYRQFFATLPETMCRLFVAEYQGVVVAANMVMVYGDTATYLHGGTADVHRDVMAPYLLQWEQMKVTKALGCTRYDFGGVKTINSQPSEHKSDWGGITKFKTGFSPSTGSTIFPGAYDIILDSRAYFLYNTLRFVQRCRRFFFH